MSQFSDEIFAFIQQKNKLLTPQRDELHFFFPLDSSSFTKHVMSERPLALCWWVGCLSYCLGIKAFCLFISELSNSNSKDSGFLILAKCLQGIPSLAKTFPLILFDCFCYSLGCSTVHFGILVSTFSMLYSCIEEG